MPPRQACVVGDVNPTQERSRYREGRQMTPYDMIKAHMTQAIPFAAHVGVELLEIGDGTGRRCVRLAHDAHQR